MMNMFKMKVKYSREKHINNKHVTNAIIYNNKNDLT